MSLSRRLLILGGLTLLPVVAVQVVNELDLRRAREAEIAQSVVLQVEQIAREQDRLIGGIRLMLGALAESRAIRDGEAEGCRRVLAALVPVSTMVQALGATRADGSVFCGADRAGGDGPWPPISDRHYFREAMRTGSFTIGTHTIGMRAGSHILPMAMAYRDAEGAIAGVVFVSVSLARLAEDLNGPDWSSERAFSIVDRDGTILVRLPEHERFVGRPFPPELWALAQRADRPGTYEVDSPLDGVRRIVGFVPPSIGPGGFYYGLGISRSAAFRALDAATAWAAFGLAAGIAAAVALAWLFGRRMIARPVADLVALTQRWRAGDLSARSGLTGAGEFAQIGAAFDAMADDLARAFAHKDVLLRELNHRIMNSLQTVASLFKLQSRSVSDPEARRQFDQAVGRITSVALAYRRIHTAGGVETVDFTGFVRELCADLAGSLMPEGRTCRVEADPLLLGPDQAMSLALIVNELVTNAIKHGGDGDVTVTLGLAAEGCRLTVRNRGSLPAEPPSGRPSGFGLQMVAAMLRQLDGRLDQASRDGEVAFTIVFVPKPAEAPALGLVEPRRRSA